MTVTQQCHHSRCSYNALWYPVLLLHRDIEGQVADPAATWKMSTALCDEHRRQVRNVHDLLDDAQIEKADAHFERNKRTAPDWRHVEVTWTRID